MNSEMIEGKDFRKECCAGNAFYCIPGNGQDVLVKAGESLIVVNNAQNHTIGSELVGRHESRFREWYDVSSNENYLDIDNPDVPNLDKWYASTLTVRSAPQPRLQRRGYRHAARRPDCKSSSSPNTRSKTPSISSTPRTAPDYTMPLRNCYRVPNEWVLDAVNTGCRDEYYIAPWDASLDAGYAWCGTADGDAYRFGKSVIRKTGFRRQTHRLEQLDQRLRVQYEGVADQVSRKNDHSL